MPRVKTTPTPRAKRDARKPATQKLARTAASVRTEVSAPVLAKREPVPEVMPPALKVSVSASSSSQRGWRHSEETTQTHIPVELVKAKTAAPTPGPPLTFILVRPQSTFCVPVQKGQAESVPVSARGGGGTLLGAAAATPMAETPAQQTGDPDLDDHLELPYSDQDDVPGSSAGDLRPESQSVPPATTPSSASNVSSRSVSPVPRLSSAWFPTSDSNSTGAGSWAWQHLAPHHPQEQRQAPPDLIAPLLHSQCGVLDEMCALRAEVAQIRAKREEPVVQLEKRVRRLEARAEPVLVASAASAYGDVASSGSEVGARLVHPLAHLIYGDFEQDFVFQSGSRPWGRVESGVGEMWFGSKFRG
ncbi:hypothetical protein B0H14DRAFT_3868554 [Mycena olivaceomarginata]|nr:hypothetical protein B0H14DRAFT_3868554 [Mycena olivaceomarginata]